MLDVADLSWIAHGIARLQLQPDERGVVFDAREDHQETHTAVTGLCVALGYAVVQVGYGASRVERRNGPAPWEAEIAAATGPVMLLVSGADRPRLMPSLGRVVRRAHEAVGDRVRVAVVCGCKEICDAVSHTIDETLGESRFRGDTRIINFDRD